MSSMILVTGGAGFIGTNMCNEIVKKGFKLIIIDNFSSGSKNNIRDMKCKIIKKDIRRIKNFPKVSIIFHLAANASVQHSFINPYESFEVNVLSTMKLLEHCRKHDIRFVFASSAAVYGNQKPPLKENTKPEPISPYGIQKYLCEKLCEFYYNTYGLETVVLRYFNVYGPYQKSNALIPNTIKRIIQNKKPVIYGTGRQTRDFIYVDDVVHATLLAGLKKNKRCFGEIINIASGTGVSVNKVVNMLLKIADKKIRPIYKKRRKEIYNSHASIGKARKLLNWKPQISLQFGLKITYNWFLSNFK